MRVYVHIYTYSMWLFRGVRRANSRGDKRIAESASCESRCALSYPVLAHMYACVCVNERVCTRVCVCRGISVGETVHEVVMLFRVSLRLCMLQWVVRLCWCVSACAVFHANAEGFPSCIPVQTPTRAHVLLECFRARSPIHTHTHFLPPSPHTIQLCSGRLIGTKSHTQRITHATGWIWCDRFFKAQMRERNPHSRVLFICMCTLLMCHIINYLSCVWCV